MEFGILIMPANRTARYQDGRKMWTNIITASRNLAQQIWIHVPLDRTGLKGPNTTTIQNVIEKKTMINLVSSLSFCMVILTNIH